MLQNLMIKDTLKSVFGFDSFREGQEEVVKAIVGGRDVLGVFPTGRGKSLMFQLPAMVMPGTTIVISPLISLMKDQVFNAKEKGINAVCVDSTMSNVDVKQVYLDLQGGKVKLLYVAPERFEVYSFTLLLTTFKIASIITDEAHCVDFGYDFRGSYLKIAEYLKNFKDAPRAAFTASATLDTQADIIDKFGLRNPVRVHASFNRDNLFYEVKEKTFDGNYDLYEIIKEHECDRGIIYRSTRAKTEETAEYLTRAGFPTLPYHAGMDSKTRQFNQEEFKSGKTKIMCATIAFGMGIDIPDIRYVIHADLPKSMEGFYQETGRAGRDGKLSRCVLLFNHADTLTIRYFIKRMDTQVRKDHAERQLQSMVNYSVNNICRRKQVLDYFGEDLGVSNCEMCDVCTEKYNNNRFTIKNENKTLFTRR